MKVEPEKPQEFTAMRGLIWRVVHYGWLRRRYEELWNPVNYALVGGMGMGINFLVNVLLLIYMPWYLSNFLAIIIAWSWNWMNSVGPLGHYWGFPRRKTNDQHSGSKPQ